MSGWGVARRMESWVEASDGSASRHARESATTSFLPARNWEDMMLRMDGIPAMVS